MGRALSPVADKRRLGLVRVRPRWRAERAACLAGRPRRALDPAVRWSSLRTLRALR